VRRDKGSSWSRRDTYPDSRLASLKRLAFKDYILHLDDENLIYVRFVTERGGVTQFVVKYNSRINDNWIEVIRYDSGHECPHKDILSPEGRVLRKVWFDYLDNAQALTLAIQDLKENYEFYRARFFKWLKSG